MSDDLVKRARHNALSDMPHYASVELIEALADRIEDLEAENADLKAKLAKVVRTLQSLIIEYDKVDLAYDEPKTMTAVYGLALDTLTELTGDTNGPA